MSRTGASSGGSSLPSGATAGQAVVWNGTSWVAGSSGEVRAQILGYQAWSYPITLISSTSTITSQQLQATALYLAAGTVVTGCAVEVSVAAAGTKPTGVWSGLADSSQKMLAQSGDLSGSGLPYNATGPIALPFSGTYTVPTSGLYYAVFLQNGSFGTTQPTLGYATTTATGTAKPFGSNMAASGVLTSQTALPANGSTFGALTASATNFWIAAY